MAGGDNGEVEEKSRMGGEEAALSGSSPTDTSVAVGAGEGEARAGGAGHGHGEGKQETGDTRAG